MTQQAIEGSVDLVKHIWNEAGFMAKYLVEHVQMLADAVRAEPWHLFAVPVLRSLWALLSEPRGGFEAEPLWNSLIAKLQTRFA